MPVALATCGIVFGPTRFHEDTLARMPLVERLLAEVGAPRPGHQDDVDRVRPRVDAELAVAVEGDRAQVALAEAVHGDQLVRRQPELLHRVRELHVQELGRLVQALEVVGQPEHRRARVRLVAADPLEHARAVVEPVGADVDLGVGPVHELAVHPDLLGRLHGSKVTRR